eukprot:jgi/Mesvir1/17629/Mv08852-RA.2
MSSEENDLLATSAAVQGNVVLPATKVSWKHARSLSCSANAVASSRIRLPFRFEIGLPSLRRHAKGCACASNHKDDASLARVFGLAQLLAVLSRRVRWGTLAGACAGVARALSLGMAKCFMDCFLPRWTWDAARGFLWAGLLSRALGGASPPDSSGTAPSARARNPLLLPWALLTRVGPLRRRLLKPFLWLQLGSPLLQRISPLTWRKLRFMGRVAPVFTGYHMRRFYILSKPRAKRDAMWDATHEWGSRRIQRVIEDMTGFFPKVGQIMGTAIQMMPLCYIRCFVATMDSNPPVPFAQIVRLVEEETGRDVGELFAELSAIPAATASIAQVHFGVLADGSPVAVKAGMGNLPEMMSDVRQMHRLCQLIKATKLDEGIDMPGIMKAYMAVLPDECDFRVEVDNIRRIQESMSRDPLLRGRVACPTPRTVDGLCSARLLVMDRMAGTKMLTVLRSAHQSGGCLCTCFVMVRRTACTWAAGVV